MLLNPSPMLLLMLLVSNSVYTPKQRSVNEMEVRVRVLGEGLQDLLQLLLVGSAY